MSENKSVVVQPLTSANWQDLEGLFGAHGAYAGCWCTFWLLKRADFNKMHAEERKAALKDITDRGEGVGVIAYVDGEPAGWCSVGPRQSFRALEASRLLKRVDDAPVWSIVCFFVAKAYRKQGFMTELLRGAVAYAAQQGAKIVEGYPIDLQHPSLAGKNLTQCSGYMGIASVFQKMGFIEVKRASETHLVMRYQVD